MADRKKNIILFDTFEALPYTGKGKPGADKKIPQRNIRQHASYLQRKFEEVFTQSVKQKDLIKNHAKDGTYIEVSGKSGYELEYKSLENINRGIRLLNSKEYKDSAITKATIYVPEDKDSFFFNKIHDYMNKTTPKSGKPKNNDLISSIENVKLANLEAFWVGDISRIPVKTPVWCEIWLRVPSDEFIIVEEKFASLCSELTISCNKRSIRFPERIVKLIYADEGQLEKLIANSPHIAEIRRAEEVTSFFSDLPSIEQSEWVNELLSRITYDFSNTAICILDTGVNSSHPLLVNMIEDDCIQAVDEAWGRFDLDGHGTAMAGIASFMNLQEILSSTDHFRIRHKLESVKILSPPRENKPELYGSITQNAVYMAEIMHPETNRVNCMSVTSGQYNSNDGSPTSWSGAVDDLAVGSYEDESKRLIIVSAGNVHPEEIKLAGYLRANSVHSIESPGQAWNAITVGAYCDSIQVKNKLYDEYSPVADAGELSPYSSTSCLWDRIWPIKPEILCEGGNITSDGTNFTESEDLSLLTTHNQPASHQFTTIWGTSAAAAQASYMAAQIMSEYPEIWPETVRALLIHSANWTNKMKNQFCPDDRKKKSREYLLRNCGYGIPNLAKALHCMQNSVNLIIESELQPYVKGKMNEMHLHRLPWPKDILRGLGETPATLRVTLSYFIEPAPGEIGWKDKYRYSSCNLRFDVINKDQSKDDFVKWINVQMRGKNKNDKGEGSSGSKDWYLGSDNRNTGSIHSDFKTLNAVDLCEAEYIAVYPVMGWWRERTHLQRYNNKMRYSLVVTISTPEIEADLYTSITTQIKQQIATKIAVKKHQL